MRSGSKKSSRKSNKKVLREALLFVCVGISLSVGLVRHVMLMHEEELAGAVAVAATAATLVIIAAACLRVAMMRGA